MGSSPLCDATTLVLVGNFKLPVPMTVVTLTTILCADPILRAMTLKLAHG
jgi:hypothetical protein